jgi:hypothetical protein
MPQQLVDTVEAKFMQMPQTTQFKMHCKQDCAMIFRLERKAEGHCIICKRVHGRENAYLSLAESGAIFFHCRRSTSLVGVEVCKRDFALAVDIEVAVALQTSHGLTCADILEYTRFLTWHHLALSEYLQLGHGKLETHGQQPPSLLIRSDTGGGKTVFLEELIKANKNMKFVGVTCRRTLADMQEARFIGFDNYQDCPGVIIRDRPPRCRCSPTFCLVNSCLKRRTVHLASAS